MLQPALTMALDKLAYAKGASWDPTITCLPGTRVTVLSMIDSWFRVMDRENILWLNGVAGSGKSAIAHTVASTLHRDNRLASSFFFNLSDPSLNTAQSFVTTIARDIAAVYPAVAEDIRMAVESDPSLAGASVLRQFEAFVADPLQRLALERPLLIVIDALDETIEDKSNLPLLEILRDELPKLSSKLRILVTSRPTRIMKQYLSNQDHIKVHSIDIDTAENQSDVAAYIDSQLRSQAMCSMMGLSYPDEALIVELKVQAEGLFIWIVTICKYLHIAYQPRAKLMILLSKSRTRGLPPTKKMDGLYGVIMEACGDWDDEDFVRDYKLVMGAIMAAKRPLSISALQAMHNVDGVTMLSPKDLLERFGSVIVRLTDDQEPIRILHLSFREFVTDSAANDDQTRKFHVSEKIHSERLAELCLRTMVRELTAEPLIGTGYLLLHHRDRPGIPKVIGISEQLLYSCEY